MAATTGLDKVMTFVEGRLKEDPMVTNETLFEGAKEIDRAVAKLSNRQFHAKYPLQVKRRNGSGRPKRSRNGRRSARRRLNGAGNREAVRDVLMKFARDLSAAESQVATIDVLADLDTYTTDILKATKV